MKNGVLIILRPFICDQRFYIFKEGEVVLEGYMPYDDKFATEIAEIAYANNLDTVNISGPYKYAVKTHGDIMHYNNSKFKEKPLKVNILSKKS